MKVGTMETVPDIERDVPPSVSETTASSMEVDSSDDAKMLDAIREGDVSILHIPSPLSPLP